MKQMMTNDLICGVTITYDNVDNRQTCYERRLSLDLNVVKVNPEKAFKKFMKEMIKECLRYNKHELKNNGIIFIDEWSGYATYEEDYSEDIKTDTLYIRHRVNYDGFSGKARVKTKHGKMYLDGWDFSFKDIEYKNKEFLKSHKDWKALGIDYYTDEELRIKKLAEKNFDIFCKTGEVIPVR